MQEEQMSINLMKLNKEYLDLYNAPYVKKARRKYMLGLKGELQLLCNFIKEKRFKELFAYAVNSLYKTDKKIVLTQNIIDSNQNITKPINKVVVYTCIINNYDKIQEPLYKNPACEFVVFTDGSVPENSVWQKRCLPTIPGFDKNKMNGTEINRWIKLHPHILFPEYEYSVYVDGNILVVADIIPIINQMGNKIIGTHILAMAVDCVYEYSKIVIAGKKAPKHFVDMQMENYKRNGYPKHNGVFENGILVREHNNIKCIKLMEDWWKELQKYTCRDQLSFNYVIWKNKMENQVYIIDYNIYQNPRFRVKPHNI